jgi:hypothetical protein
MILLDKPIFKPDMIKLFINDSFPAKPKTIEKKKKKNLKSKHYQVQQARTQ